MRSGENCSRADHTFPWRWRPPPPPPLRSIILARTTNINPTQEGDDAKMIQGNYCTAIDQLVRQPRIKFRLRKININHFSPARFIYFFHSQFYKYRKTAVPLPRSLPAAPPRLSPPPRSAPAAAPASQSFNILFVVKVGLFPLKVTERKS